MPTSLLYAVGAGVLSALFYLSASWGAVLALVLAFFAPLPLFAAGLSLGFSGAVVAAAAGGLAIGAAGGVTAAAMYLAIDALPVVIVVRFALLYRVLENGRDREWYPPGLLLGWLTVYGAAGFTAVALAMGSELQAAIESHTRGVGVMLGETSGNAAAAEEMVKTLQGVFPFLAVAWWIGMMAVNGVVAQKLLVRAGFNRRPSPDFRMTRPPQLMSGAIIAAAVVALLGSGWPGFVATNVALILCVAYFLAGLAVVHAVSANWPARTGILAGAYVLLVLFGWPVIVITGLGLIEQWMGWRSRSGPPGPGNERNE